MKDLNNNSAIEKAGLMSKVTKIFGKMLECSRKRYISRRRVY